MNWELLKEKSEENLKTAQWAEGESYFDVALSRYYYYSTYQKIMYICEKQKFRSIKTSKTKGKNSHIETIDKFIANIKNKLSNEVLTIILGVQKLRSERNKVDYKPLKIKNYEEFENMFKKDYDNVNPIINKLIGDD